MGGLVDSTHDWKEYFWVIQVDPLETKLDFQYTWCQPIHCRSELKEEEFGPHDRFTVQQMKKFVERYLERHEPPVKEFNAKEIVTPRGRGATATT